LVTALCIEQSEAWISGRRDLDVCELVGEGTYRERAGAIQREIAALRGPEHAVGLLERLAVEKQPIPAG
jgi:hypothetical protein